MVISDNCLNIDETPRGWRVVGGDGLEQSGIHSREEIHALCCALCICEKSYYVNPKQVLSMSGGTNMWLDFQTGFYIVRDSGYVPEWYEIYIGTTEEVNQWLNLIC
jgi:hypothetical protein